METCLFPTLPSLGLTGGSHNETSTQVSHPYMVGGEYFVDVEISYSLSAYAKAQRQSYNGTASATSSASNIKTEEGAVSLLLVQ